MAFLILHNYTDFIYPWEQKYILLFSFVVSIITLLVDENIRN